MEYLPYTYLIGWSSLHKFYYGAEYSIKTKVANPSNLWTIYFTSSNIVAFYRDNYGEPDIVQIRKVFNSGTDAERMENTLKWEKKVLSKIDITDSKWLNGRIGGDICPEANRKISQLRYGVDNVFQADEIKEKIKSSLLESYGVNHPSKSLELMQKKEENNYIKYGFFHTFQIPEVKEKSRKTMIERYGAPTVLQSDYLKNKIENTLIEKYGVSNSSQIDFVKEKKIRNQKHLSARSSVKLIREYMRLFGISLGSGWYQKSDAEIMSILEDLKIKYGEFCYEEIRKMKKPKQYSCAIKKLQNRDIVQTIKKYKDRYKEIKLGRVWDRKNDEYLNGVLQELILRYGEI